MRSEKPSRLSSTIEGASGDKQHVARIFTKLGACSLIVHVLYLHGLWNHFTACVGRFPLSQATRQAIGEPFSFQLHSDKLIAKMLSIDDLFNVRPNVAKIRNDFKSHSRTKLEGTVCPHMLSLMFIINKIISQGVELM